MSHTPEPWKCSPALGRILNSRCEAFFNSEHQNALIEAADAERAVTCVNACAGTEDPAAAIQAAREALEAVEQIATHANGKSKMCPLCKCIHSFDEEHKSDCLIGKAFQLLTPKP